MTEIYQNKEFYHVEAFGLTGGARHQNGKLGMVVEKATDATGNVTVIFFESTPSGFVQQSGPPRLINPTKLKNLKIAPGKDHPGFCFLVGDERVLVRIERGEGKSCVDCDSDLGGKYYVYHEIEYRCEKYFPNRIAIVTVCSICSEYIPGREIDLLPVGAMQQYFPDETSTVAEQHSSKFPIHKAWFACCLCGFYPDCFRKGDDILGPKQRDVFSGKLGFLCKGRLDSTSSCAIEYLDYVAVKKQFLTVENLPVGIVQDTLRQRNVQCAARESKDSLVRKIMVTDQKVLKKTSEVLHRNTRPALRVTLRNAPLPVLRNRHCTHGFDEAACDATATPEYVAEGLKIYGSSNFSMPHSVSLNIDDFFVAMIEAWNSKRGIFQADMVERRIPRLMWSKVVEKYVRYESNHEISFLYLAQCISISAIMDMITLRPRMEEADLLRKLTRRLYRTVETLSMGQKELVAFLHCPERRLCECLAYVATAAEIGLLSSPDEILKEAKHCAMCGEGLANPKICSRCQKVGYCNAEHQKLHWKEHKKSCNPVNA